MLFDVAARVLANTPLSPDYNVIALEAPEIAAATAPGQFVMVKPRPGLDPLLRRPFSVFEILRDARGNATGISLLNKRVGIGTGMLYAAQPGDSVQVLGPLGRPFTPVDPPSEAWMVAGGVGLAPFVTLAEALAARGTKMRLFYGARSAADLYYADFFGGLGATLYLTTEDGSRGELGRVTVPLSRVMGECAQAPLAIYTCGPTPMMRAVAEIGEAAGKMVFVSLEQVMGCGMGGCYSCVVPVRRGNNSGIFVRSCLDGPVFDSRAIIWNALGTGH